MEGHSVTGQIVGFLVLPDGVHPVHSSELCKSKGLARVRRRLKEAHSSQKTQTVEVRELNGQLAQTQAAIGEGESQGCW